MRVFCVCKQSKIEEKVIVSRAGRDHHRTEEQNESYLITHLNMRLQSFLRDFMGVYCVLKLHCLAERVTLDKLLYYKVFCLTLFDVLVVCGVLCVFVCLLCTAYCVLYCVLCTVHLCTSSLTACHEQRRCSLSGCRC
jgi:hypothetical protein